MAAKKTTKKSIETDSVAKLPTEVNQEQFVAITQKPHKTRYRFYSTVTNLNISNVIFDNIKVVIFECVSDSAKEAIERFRNMVLTRFDGDTKMYDMFMAAVFGGKNNITLESISVNNITEEVITL